MTLYFNVSLKYIIYLLDIYLSFRYILYFKFQIKKKIFAIIQVLDIYYTLSFK